MSKQIYPRTKTYHSTVKYSPEVSGVSELAVLDTDCAFEPFTGKDPEARPPERGGEPVACAEEPGSSLGRLCGGCDVDSVPAPGLDRRDDLKGWFNIE